MRAVTERHAREVEGTVIDLQLAGIVRTVQQHADTAGIDAGSVFIGQLAVGIDGVKGEITAVQHGRTVAQQRRAGGGLGDRFQHRLGHVVGIRAVDELEIIDVKITRTPGAVLGGGNTHRIGAAHINGHLEGRNIRFHPGPALTCPVAERTAAHRAVSIVAVVLNISRRTGKLLTVNVAHAAIIIQLHVGGIKVVFKRSALQHSLEDGSISSAILWHIDPQTDSGRLHRIYQKVTGETEVRCGNRRCGRNIGKIIA